MINYRETPGMLRMLRAEAAKVREQNAEREQVVDLPQPVQVTAVAS